MSGAKVDGLDKFRSADKGMQCYYRCAACFSIGISFKSVLYAVYYSISFLDI